MSASQHHPALLSKAAAARRLGCSRETVRLLIEAGRLREIPVRPGGRPRLLLDEVERFARGEDIQGNVP